jgi:prolipoprotein diacylglyceryl transferase
MRTLMPAELFIPSPTVSAFSIGPLTIHFYALAILSGIVLAVWLTDRRLSARGGGSEKTLDVVMWAVPFGIVGGRAYHVITDYQLYFGPGQDPWDAFRIWEGGLGIWGAVALGALGAWIGCRRNGIPLPAFADAAAPGLIFAQAIGRWGNWFNNELYGSPTDVPWKLEIHQMGMLGAARNADGTAAVLGYYHPTFLYESLWSLTAGVILLLADRRLRLGAGSVFALYVVLYTAGRFVVELMRTDYANTILGLRVNTWVSGVLLIAGLAAFLAWRRRSPSSVAPAAAAAEGEESGRGAERPSSPLAHRD